MGIGVNKLLVWAGIGINKLLVRVGSNKLLVRVELLGWAGEHVIFTVCSLTTIVPCLWIMGGHGDI